MKLHHKKMDNVIPAWLYFALFPAGLKVTDKELKNELALRIKKNLIEHLRQHDLQNDIITEPNNHDTYKGYLQSPTQ